MLSFVALIASICSAPQIAIAQNGAQSAQSPVEKGEYSAVQLLQLMDKDRNGKVSRAEFMKFMNEEFDRLDINKDGELDVNELAELHLHYLRGSSR